MSEFFASICTDTCACLTLDCATMPASIKISDYVDGNFLGSCGGGGCANGQPSWGGGPMTGNISPVTECFWFSGAIPTIYTVGSKAFYAAYVSIVAGAWYMEIILDQDYGCSYTGWIGTKVLGSTVLGVFTRSSGCFTAPATLTVAAYP